MDTSEFLDLFIIESREHLERQAGLLSRAGSAGLAQDEINELFRHAHSIKGMAQSMGFRAVSSLAHAMEDILHAWRDGGAAPDPAAIARLLEANDRLAAQIDALAAHQPEPDATDLVATLRAAPVAAVPAPAPALAPAPVDAGGPGRAGRRRLDIVLRPGTPLPAARAAVIAGRLREHAGELALEPDPATRPPGQFPLAFAILLASRVPAERLAAIVTDLADVASCRVAAPAAGEPPRPETEPGRQEAIGTVRVATERMDHLLDGIGELILDRERLKMALPPESGAEAGGFLEALGRTIDALRVEVMAMRLLPFSSIVPRLERSARDLSQRLGKTVSLEVRGGEISLDRSILEDLMEPLQHILRNGIDHGVEDRDTRRAAGKPETGRITIALTRRDDRVCLAVSDDGRGMDPDALRRVAVQRRFLTREAAQRLTDAEALMLVTLPGFSTAARTTDISGRGVGMDVVRMSVQKLGGRLSIHSAVGTGARLEMDLPPAMTVTRAFLCRSLGEVYAVPVSAVQATLEVRRDRMQASQGEQMMQRGDDLVIILPLGGLLAGESSPAWPPSFPAFMYRVGDRAYALAVDEILGEQEIVIKPLRHPLELLPQYAGAAILNDGRIALILDPANLTRTARAA